MRKLRSFICLDCGKPTERYRKNSDVAVCFECGKRRAEVYADRLHAERLARRDRFRDGQPTLEVESTPVS